MQVSTESGFVVAGIYRSRGSWSQVSMQVSMELCNGCLIWKVGSTEGVIMMPVVIILMFIRITVASEAFAWSRVVLSSLQKDGFCVF